MKATTEMHDLGKEFDNNEEEFSRQVLPGTNYKLCQILKYCFN